MDTLKLKGNRKFEETWYMEIPKDAVVLKLKESPEFCIYVSEEYFWDIFGKPSLHGLGWHGFTRDYCESKGVFKHMEDDWVEMNNPKEYLEDMLQYKEKQFRYKKTPDVFELIVDFISYAIETGQTVTMRAE